MEILNPIVDHKKFLENYHYICGYSQETDFWGGIKKDEIERYFLKYGFNFNFIVYDSLNSSLYYSIPFREIRECLNENEGFLSHQGKEGRWQFTIKNDVMGIHGTKYRINVGIYKNDISNIPQLQFFNDIDILTEIYSEDSELQSFTEGKKRVIISTKIERDKKLREEAIKIFGYNCAVCNFNFEEKYGAWGHNFVEVHHIQPLSELNGEERELNPLRDLIVLCANCHRMVHRKKGTTLTAEELKSKLGKNELFVAG